MHTSLLQQSFERYHNLSLICLFVVWTCVYELTPTRPHATPQPPWPCDSQWQMNCTNNWSKHVSCTKCPYGSVSSWVILVIGQCRWGQEHFALCEWRHRKGDTFWGFANLLTRRVNILSEVLRRETNISFKPGELSVLQRCHMGAMTSPCNEVLMGREHGLHHTWFSTKYHFVMNIL